MHTKPQKDHKFPDKQKDEGIVVHKKKNRIIAKYIIEQRRQ